MLVCTILDSVGFSMAQHPIGGTTIWSPGLLSSATAKIATEVASSGNEVVPDLVQAAVDEVIASMPPDHFRSGDHPVLEAFARAIVVERRIGQAMMDHPYSVTLSERSSYDRAIKTLGTLALKLGLCPQARQKHGGRRRKTA
jgi:hypothetical protein